MAIQNNPVGGSPYKFEGMPTHKVEQAAGEKLDLDGNKTIDKEEQEIAQAAAGKDAIVIDNKTNTIELKADAVPAMEKAKETKDEIGKLCKEHSPLSESNINKAIGSLESKLENIYISEKATPEDKKIAQKKIDNVMKSLDDPEKRKKFEAMMNQVPPNTTEILKNVLLLMKGDGSGC